MKHVFGLQHSQLLKGYKSVLDDANALQRNRITTIIQAVAWEESIMFLELFCNDSLYTVDTIAKQFEFKEQFITTCMMDKYNLQSLEFTKAIKDQIRSILNDFIDQFISAPGLHEIVLQSKEKGMELFKLSDPRCVALSRHDVESLLKVFNKKLFFLGDALACYLVEHWEIVNPEANISIDYKTARRLLGYQWCSMKTLKDELDFSHDVEVRRYLKRKSNYMKLVQKLDSDRKSMARYIRL